MLNNYETGVDGSIVEICRPNEVVSVVIVVESEDASSKDGSVLLSSVLSFNSFVLVKEVIGVVASLLVPQ